MLVKGAPGLILMNEYFKLTVVWAHFQDIDPIDD